MPPSTASLFPVTMMTKPALVALLVAIALSPCAAAADKPLPTLKPYNGPKLDLAGAIHTVGLEGADHFIIACWVPSMYDLDKFAKRGINVAWFNQRLNPKEK